MVALENERIRRSAPEVSEMTKEPHRDLRNETIHSLALIMPAFNEASTIPGAVRRVLEQDFVGQLIVVDDGSTDGTLEALTKVDSDRLIMVRHEVNRGKGAAIRTGLTRVTAPFVGIQDADLEWNPKDLRPIIELLVQDRADVVYGSRFLTAHERRVLYYWHSVGNKLLTQFSNAFSNLNLTDMETCYKVFRTSVLKSI